MTMTTDERSFLDAHKVYFDQARMNFLHGFSPYVMAKFEEIHGKYVRPGFILTPWCTECVLDMVNKLGTWYESIVDQESLAFQAGSDNVAAQFMFPDDLDTIPVQRGETVMDAPVRKSKGRPKKKK